MPYKDKTVEAAKKRGYRMQRREIVQRIKLERGCSICGYDKSPFALQFHHLDDKYDDVNKMLGRNTSMDRILKEIDKCIVLCANCHAELHYGA